MRLIALLSSMGFGHTWHPFTDRSELLIRMLIVGYCFGTGSERQPCEEVHLNLAYRWFCRLGLDGSVSDQLSAQWSASICTAPG